MSDSEYEGIRTVDGLELALLATSGLFCAAAIAVGLSLVFPPILVWGGNACATPDSIAEHCSTPPLGLLVSWVAGYVIAFLVNDRLKRRMAR